MYFLLTAVLPGLTPMVPTITVLSAIPAPLNSSTAGRVDGKLRYAVNSVPHRPCYPALAEYHQVVHKVFKYDTVQDQSADNVGDKITLAPNVVTPTCFFFYNT